MHLKLVAFSGETNQLRNVIDAILHVDVLARLLFATLIDIQNLTNMPTPANFFHQKLRLHGPAAARWRVIPNLKDSHVWFRIEIFELLHATRSKERRLAVWSN